jgi:hypothetical protein
MIRNKVFEALKEVLGVMSFITFENVDPEIRKMSVDLDGVVGDFKVALQSFADNVDRGGGDTTSDKGITLATIRVKIVVPKVFSRKPRSSFFIIANKRMNVLTELAFKDLDMLGLGEEKTVKGERIRNAQEGSLITYVIPRTDRLHVVSRADRTFIVKKMLPRTRFVKQGLKFNKEFGKPGTSGTVNKRAKMNTTRCSSHLSHNSRDTPTLRIVNQ